MVKVCHFYYRDQLTMAEIGDRLSMSRHRVGRLLKDALESGIVKIEIEAPSNENEELERALERRFGLKASLIVDVLPDLPPDDVKRVTCKAGAGLARELLEPTSIIGVGWGSTTFELVRQFEPLDLPGATVVQITGGNKRVSVQFDCNEVTRRLAEKLNVEPVLLHAPGIVDKAETRALLMRETAIAETFRRYGQIDIAIVGIGSIVPEVRSLLVQSGYIPDTELTALRSAGAVGDVFSYFLDADGQVVRTGLYDRLITIGLPEIRRIATTIGIATGAAKARAVAAAMRGGFVNILVADSGLAQALVAMPMVASKDGQPPTQRRGPQLWRPPGGPRAIPETAIGQGNQTGEEQ